MGFPRCIVQPPSKEIKPRGKCSSNLVESEKQRIVVYLVWLSKKLLQYSVSGPFVVLFDESLNTKMQEKQMDAHVRFWNDQTNQVTTRYFNSEFLGEC